MGKRITKICNKERWGFVKIGMGRDRRNEIRKGKESQWKG